MSLNTEIFYQHLSATVNRVLLHYQHPIKQTHVETQQLPDKLHPLSLQSTSTITPLLLLQTSQLTPQIYNTTTLPTYPSNFTTSRLVQPRPNTRSHSVGLKGHNNPFDFIFRDCLKMKFLWFRGILIKDHRWSYRWEIMGHGQMLQPL